MDYGDYGYYAITWCWCNSYELVSKHQQSEWQQHSGIPHNCRAQFGSCLWAQAPEDTNQSGQWLSVPRPDWNLGDKFAPEDLSATLTATLKATLVKQLDTIYTMFEIHLIISDSCKDVPRHWLVFVLQIHEVLDNPWHQPRTFPAFRTEEEGRGGEKEKTPGHEVGKVDKNSNSILWQGGPKVYQGGPVWIRLLIHWFRLDLCRVGFLHRKTAFYLRRLYRLSGAAASQAQKEEEA